MTFELFTPADHLAYNGSEGVPVITRLALNDQRPWSADIIIEARGVEVYFYLPSQGEPVEVWVLLTAEGAPVVKDFREKFEVAFDQCSLTAVTAALTAINFVRVG